MGMDSNATLTFIEYLLRERHRAAYFACSRFLNLHNNLVYLPFLFIPNTLGSVFSARLTEGSGECSSSTRIYWGSSNTKVNDNSWSILSHS